MARITDAFLLNERPRDTFPESKKPFPKRTSVKKPQHGSRWVSGSLCGADGFAVCHSASHKRNPQPSRLPAVSVEKCFCHPTSFVCFQRFEKMYFFSLLILSFSLSVFFSSHRGKIRKKREQHRLGQIQMPKIQKKIMRGTQSRELETGRTVGISICRTLNLETTPSLAPRTHKTNLHGPHLVQAFAYSPAKKIKLTWACLQDTRWEQRGTQGWQWNGNKMRMKRKERTSMQRLFQLAGSEPWTKAFNFWNTQALSENTTSCASKRIQTQREKIENKKCVTHGTQAWHSSAEHKKTDRMIPVPHFRPKLKAYMHVTWLWLLAVNRTRINWQTSGSNIGHLRRQWSI